jgi:hypothetical protein
MGGYQCHGWLPMPWVATNAMGGYQWSVSLGQHLTGIWVPTVWKNLEKVWNSVISLINSGKSLENCHLVKNVFFGWLSGDLMLRQNLSKSYQLGLDFWVIQS